MLAEADADGEAEELGVIIAEEDSCLLADVDADGLGDGEGKGESDGLVSAKHFLSYVLIALSATTLPAARLSGSLKRQHSLLKA